MPTIKVTVPKNAWTTEEKSNIAVRLTEALNAVAQDAGKGDITQYINAHIEETAEGGYAVGGHVVGQQVSGFAPVRAKQAQTYLALFCEVK